MYNENTLVDSEKPLFTDKELYLMLNYERGGKGLVWNNFFKEVAKGKQYQGQWTTDKAKSVYEGLGCIKFESGSKYEG